jgi:hypothetical protein
VPDLARTKNLARDTTRGQTLDAQLKQGVRDHIRFHFKLFATRFCRRR